MEDPCNVIRDVETDGIEQGERANRHAERGHVLLDLFAACGSLLQTEDRLIQVCHQNAVHQESRAVLDGDRDFSDAFGKAHHVLHRLRVSRESRDDFHQWHGIRGVEEVEANNLSRPPCRRAQGGDRQGRGIACQNRSGRAGGIQVTQHLLLETEVLRDRLNHEIHVAERHELSCR